ncbi:peptide deformylase [Arsenicicoccus piscis]|uniref:Peptide deformylase n=1 Tax=Arsenicicoccus piscis TaxID=673954 RepID=A0ABQ6HM46_9MICO|nr:peptide deformylase [Arsenicicoccus piscis]MCH8628674.1 peptide deformylase [Arsenicicoccus piscis]GMA19392.1 peptide deformylase [Arsenicicoccus piscis]
MTVRPVVIYGEPVLHRRAEAVTVFDDELRALVADMDETMERANGVGLAAPQIGVGLRIFTWAMRNDDGVPARGHIINPVVTTSGRSSGTPDPDEDSEGCLSVPGESYPLVRPLQAHVIGFDVDGRQLEFDATGWFARCMQHEYDHLNGTLYVDRLEGRQARKAKKMLRAHGWTVPGNSWMPGVDRDPFGHDDEHDEHDDHEHDVAAEGGAPTHPEPQVDLDTPR